MPPDHVTKRVALLKEHLGIEDKRLETVARELEALRLYRSAPAARPAAKTGPAPKGGLSYREIGERLGRSERWGDGRSLRTAPGGCWCACSCSALRPFDPLARKFTSSELLDAGFNVSMVAQRQGHGPQVLTKHYSKGRRSADRKAAEHLGRVVHQGATPLASAEPGP